MQRDLSDQEIETLVEIVVRTQGDDSPLVGAARSRTLTGDQEVELADLVTNELATRGFDANYEPTSYGVQLENLVDVLNDV
jgi:hypothetical protein